MVRVEIYRKAGCGLCDELHHRLDELRRELPFEVVDVDITGDAAAERRFGLRIPVVLVDGRRVAEGRVEDLTPLRRAIEAAGR
jgi:glutaredoxin